MVQLSQIVNRATDTGKTRIVDVEDEGVIWLTESI